MPKRESVAGTPADPTIEFVPLEIDGQTYNLAYSFNAIADAEKIADCNLLHGIAALLLNGMTALQVRGLLYAALRMAHPKLTLAHAGLMVRIDTVQDIRDALLAAYNASLPEKSKFKAVKDPPEGEAAAPEN